MHKALVTLGPFLAFCGISAVAQPKFGAPLMGVARDGQKQIRLVDGVAGNFVLRDAIDGKALDWAFAGRGLVKTDRELLVVGATGAVVRRRAAPSGDAVLSPEAAFFPATGALWQIGAEKDHATQVPPEVVAGTVMALGPLDAGSVRLAVCRGDQLWLMVVDVKTGAIRHELSVGGAIGGAACRPARAASLVVMTDRLLLATAQELLVQTTAGTERRIPISGNPAVRPEIHRTGEQWIEVESAGSMPLMVRLTAESEKLYHLPAPGAHP